MNDQYKIITAPGPNEIKDSEQLDAISILDIIADSCACSNIQSKCMKELIN